MTLLSVAPVSPPRWAQLADFEAALAWHRAFETTAPIPVHAIVLLSKNLVREGQALFEDRWEPFASAVDPALVALAQKASQALDFALLCLVQQQQACPEMDAPPPSLPLLACKEAALMWGACQRLSADTDDLSLAWLRLEATTTRTLLDSHHPAQALSRQTWPAHERAQREQGRLREMAIALGALAWAFDRGAPWLKIPLRP